MEPPPLISRRSQEEYPEASHVLREVFQDVLPQCTYPSNVLRNLDEKVVDETSRLPKQRCLSAKLAIASNELNMEVVKLVEEDIMSTQAEYMIKENFISKSVVLSEAIKLKHAKIFKDLEVNDRKQFQCLLDRQDYLPNKAVIAIDFRYNKNVHNCKKCSSPLNFLPTKLNKDGPPPKKTANFCYGQTRKRKIEPRKTEPVLKTHPKAIVFSDYEVNKLYRKAFRLKNVSKQMRHFMLPILPTTCHFKLHLDSIVQLAPGMSVLVHVTFQTDSLRDEEETITISADTGYSLKMKLKSYRKPPMLSVYNHRNEECSFFTDFQDFDNLRAGALNFTLDCGGCFLGDRIHSHLIILNEGGKGKFFFMTEDEWYSENIRSICMHTELNMGEFEVYPSYFDINSREFVYLCLTFVPTEFGLHTEKLFLLCDNNTYEELEIVGDGIVFEKDLVQIDTPPKKENCSFMDSQSDHYMYLGECIAFCKYSCKVIVKNSRWEKRKSQCFSENTILKQMNLDWVEMQCHGDYLEPEGDTHFTITVSTDTLRRGIYSMVYRFYVQDIPEVSLGENTDFTVVCSKKQNDDPLKPTMYFDVLIGEIEVACLISVPQVIIGPPFMDLPLTFNYKDEITKRIYMFSSYKLLCKWKVSKNEKNCISILPMEFTLQANELFHCLVTISARSYEDINEKFALFVNGNIIKYDYTIKIRVTKPRLEFSKLALNFGYIPFEMEVQKSFAVINNSEEEMQWQIVEFTYDFINKRIHELPESRVSIVNGSLKAGDRIEVDYTANAMEVHSWFSFLLLLSCHPNKTASDALMLVTYEICQPQIYIHSHCAAGPLLCPQELLYVGVTQHYGLCMHNTGRIPGYFIWGEPVGTQSGAVSLSVEPRSGVIEPDDALKLTVMLTPVRAGLFENIYLPCFIGRTDEPIMVKVMCAVDSCRVMIYLPDNIGRYTKISWPSHSPYNCQCTECTTVLEIPHEEEAKIDLIQYESTDDIKELYNRKSVEEETVEIVEEQEQDEVVVEEEEEEGQEQIEEIEEVFRHSSLLSINSTDRDYQIQEEKKAADEESVVETESSEVNAPEVASSTFSVRNFFKGNLDLLKNVLEFNNVPIHTPVKKSFVIENLTPMQLYFNVEASNFDPVIQQRSFVEDLLEKTRIKRSNRWEKLLESSLGIAVYPNPSSGDIRDYESVELDLWVYANTWGVYVEEIAVEISNGRPFCFNLLIQVSGLPLEYPMALNSIQKELVIRFGSVSYKSDWVKRQLKIKNISAVPVMVAWHIFLKDSKRRDDQPFNLVCDIQSTASTTPSRDFNQEKLFITDHYYGREALNDSFEIVPREIILEPHATNAIQLNFNPKNYHGFYYEKVVRALLVGYIHLTEDMKYQENLYFRPTGVNSEIAKLKITATVETPVLNLHLLHGDLKMTAYVNDILYLKKCLPILRLVFKNVSNATARFTTEIEAPFHIVHLRTEDTIRERTDVITLQPSECLEVHVDYNIHAALIIKLAEMLYENNGVTEILDYQNFSVCIKRFLTLLQQGVVVQRLPLELKLFFPIIYISEDSVFFELTPVGCSHKKHITVHNKTASPVEFYIDRVLDEEAFLIRPTKGTLPPATSTSDSSVVIFIYFLPRNIYSKIGTYYYEHLKIVTNFPKYFKEVHIQGDASHNEKFYTDIT